MAASEMIARGGGRANELDVTIRPLSGMRAQKPRYHVSISSASRTPTGVNSTPNDRAAALQRAQLATSGGELRHRAGPPTRVDAGRNLLEQLKPFPADAVLEQREACDVAARPLQARNEAAANRVCAVTNTIGIVRVACLSGATVVPPAAKITSGASATNSAANRRMRSGSPAPHR